MKHSLLAATLAIGLAAPALSAEDAKERGGGGGSSAMDRAPSSSSSGHSSSSSSSGSSGGSSSTYSASSNNGSSTAAENRHPRPGTGHGFRSRGGSSYYPYYYPYSYGGYSYYGYPYYYGYWSYDPFYARPYGHYAYGSRTAHDYGALRVLVEPAKARVYVDGYYAGVADDFDGIFQRLSVSPGRHEITLKLEGYRTHRVRLYLSLIHI